MSGLFFAFRYSGKCCLLCIISIIWLCGCATIQFDLRPEDGFRDIAWKTPIENVPNMKLLEKGGGNWKWASREPEQLKIGDVEVDSITYIYVDGEFAGVDVVYSGGDRFGQLMRQLDQTLGQPKVVNKQMKMVSWNRDGATVLLRYYAMQGNGSLKYTLDRLTSN